MGAGDLHVKKAVPARKQCVHHAWLPHQALRQSGPRSCTLLHIELDPMDSVCASRALNQFTVAVVPIDTVVPAGRYVCCTRAARTATWTAGVVPVPIMNMTMFFTRKHTIGARSFDRFSRLLFRQALPSRLGAPTAPPIAAARSANTLCEGGREKTRWCTAHSSRNVSRLLASYSRISSSISCSLSSAATSSRSYKQEHPIVAVKNPRYPGCRSPQAALTQRLLDYRATYLLIDCLEYALKIGEAPGRRRQIALETFAVLEDVQTGCRRHLTVRRTRSGVCLRAKIATHFAHPLLQLLVLFKRRVISATAMNGTRNVLNIRVLFRSARQ